MFSERTGRRSDHGADEIAEDFLSLTVSPNPAKDFVIFNIQSVDEYANSKLEIRDLNGRLLYAQSEIKGTERIRWNAEGLASGIYFYQLLSEDALIETGKVILME